MHQRALDYLHAVERGSPHVVRMGIELADDVLAAAEAWDDRSESA